MTIGATEGKEPDFVGNGDLKTVEELRAAYKDMHKAKLSLNERASISSVMTEIGVVKQQLETTQEQLRRLIGLYGTLQQQFQDYEAARHRELGLRVGGGSTTPEDYNGADSRSGN